MSVQRKDIDKSKLNVIWVVLVERRGSDGGNLCLPM